MTYSTDSKNGNQKKSHTYKTFPGDFFKNLEKEFENVFGFDWPGLQRPQANIKDYEDRKKGKVRQADQYEEKHVHDEDKCYCPYCDTEISEGDTVCKNCVLSVDDRKATEGGEG